MQAQNDFVLKKIKWKPKIQLDEGLDISIKWYRSFIQRNYK